MEGTELVVADKGESTTLAKKKDLVAFDLEGGNLPDLDNASIMPFSLNADYWTPEKEGEFKNAFFLEIRPELMKSFGSEDIIELDAVILVENRGGILRQYMNASKTLVGKLMTLVDNGYVKKGTPLHIVYEGKVKNKTNANYSPKWGIYPMSI